MVVVERVVVKEVGGSRTSGGAVVVMTMVIAARERYPRESADVEEGRGEGHVQAENKKKKVLRCLVV